MMEGGGEGIGPIIQELQDAAIAVTVLNRRLLETASTSLRRRRHSIESSVQTNTELERSFGPKCHIGIHALDGHYMSSYRIAHCCASPTSSPQSSPEYPPRLHRPSRERGNFKVGSFYTSPNDSISWKDRETFYSREPQNVMEAFVQSLRKYPTTSPERDSSEIVQKLINYTQNKYSNRNSVNQFGESSPIGSPEGSLKNVNKTKSKPSRDFGSNTTNDLRTKVPYMRGQCFDAYNNYSSSINKYKDNGTYSYLNSPCPSKMTYSRSTCPSRMTSPSRMTCQSKMTSPSRTPPSSRPRKLYSSQSPPPCVQHQPGYFNEIRKYIKDTIKQIYENEPAVCPRIRSRYSHHRRRHHTIPDIEVELPGPSCSSPVPLVSPASSHTCPSHRPCPRKTVPTRDLNCPHCQKPVPCFCKKFIEEAEAEAGIKDVIYKWVKELPVTADDTLCNKAQREELIDKLAKEIKNLRNDPEFEKKARDAIIKCLQYLPIWYPSNPAELDTFKNNISDDLSNRIKCFLVAYSVKNVVKKKLTTLQYNQPVDLEPFAEKFKTNLTPLLGNADQLKSKVAELVLELPIANKNEALSSIVEDFLNELTKLPGETKTEIRDISDAEIKNVICEWLKNSPELSPNVEPDIIKDLVQKFYDTQKKHLGDQAEQEQMTKDTVEWINCLLKSRHEILDSNTKQNLANKLIDAIKGTKVSTDVSKARKRWSHEAVLQSINDEIYDLIKDIPSLDTKEKVDNVSQKIANVLTKRSNELSTNTLSVIEEIAEILITNADVSDTDAENLASAIVSRVKGMNIVKKRTSFDSKTIFSNEDLEQGVRDQVAAAFEEYHVDRNESLENTIVDSLLYEIVRGHDDNTRDDIISALIHANVSEDIADSIAARLLDKSKEFSTSTPTRSRSSHKIRKGSTLSSIHDENVDNFTFPTASEIRIHHEKENQYSNDLKDKIKSWIDDLPISSQEKSYLKPTMSDLTNDIMDRQKYLQINPNVSNTHQEELDNLKYQVFRWINKIPKMEGKINLIIEETEDLMDKLSEIYVPALAEPSKRSERRGSRSSKAPSPSGSMSPSEHYEPSQPSKRSERRGSRSSKAPSPSGSMSPSEHYEPSQPSKRSERRGSRSSKAPSPSGSMSPLEHYEPSQPSKRSDRRGVRSSKAPSPSGSISPSEHYEPSQPSKRSDRQGSGSSKGPSLSESKSPSDNYEPSKQKSILKHGVENAVKNLAKSLPLQKGSKEIPQNNLDNLTRKVTDIFSQDNTIKDKTKEKIGKEIKNFVKKSPVDKNAVNINDVTEEFINNINQPSKTQEGYSTTSELSPQNSIESAVSSYSTGTNTSLKLPLVKNTANELFESIEKWSKNLPLKGDTPEEKEKINKIKMKIANRLTQKVGELNMNPEAFKDNFMFEQLFEDEIDNLVSEMPELKKDLPQLQKDLMNKIKESRRKSQKEMAGKEYKQQLRDASWKTLPNETLSEEDKAHYEVLKDDVVDGFLNLHYADETSNAAAEHRKQVREKIDKFAERYLNNHPNAPIDTATLNKNLYEALKSVPPPKEGTEALKNEVELIKTKKICDEWVKKNQLFKDETPVEKLHKNKALSVLATKIKEIEEIKQQSPDLAYDEALKKEINKWLTKTAEIDRDDIGKITDDLISMLQDSEPSRHIDVTTGHSVGHEYYLSTTDITDGMRPRIPPSTLGVQDRLYMEEVRQRNREGYCCFDDVTCGAQASQQSTEGVGRAPQMIVKEYYWNPETCKFCQLPSSAPGIVPPCTEIPQTVEMPPCAQPLASQGGPPCSGRQPPCCAKNQESVPCPAFQNRSTNQETSLCSPISAIQVSAPCPGRLADQASATYPGTSIYQENPPYPLSSANQETAPYYQKLVYPESPPCLHKPVPCPHVPAYSDNPSFSQSTAYQESAPCPPCTQKSAHQNPSPCPRIPPAHESPYPNRTNYPQSPLRDRPYPFHPLPRRPLIRPRVPCKISQSQLPPCTAKTSHQSQTCPRTIPSWRNAANIPSIRKLRISSNIDDPSDEELENEEDDDDDDDVFFNENREEKYDCRCEARSSSNRCRRGSKDEKENCLKKCSKCCGIQCPYPSYCYFNP